MLMMTCTLLSHETGNNTSTSYLASQSHRSSQSSHSFDAHTQDDRQNTFKLKVSTRLYRQLFKMAEEVEDDGLWEKPAWAKGGLKLKSTGKAEAMKTKGDLAAPITNIRDDKDALNKIKETQGK